MRTAAPGVGEGARAMLGVRGRALMDAALPALLNDLTTIDEDIHLILDDYHVLSDAELHRSVAYLLAHQPARLHLGDRDPQRPAAAVRAAAGARGDAGDPGH
ncbi:MAG TPA: hypothetical protein VFO16_09900, partial [Pseudonocardiaceae bacterium]|nr:hypothetical protein [Pseudonocardiaceae bacterium]